MWALEYTLCLVCKAGARHNLEQDACVQVFVSTGRRADAAPARGLPDTPTAEEAGESMSVRNMDDFRREHSPGRRFGRFAIACPEQ
jgi:hypothetical protein